ncbi:hypothetical protein HNP52_000505 [Sphingomonas kyeonggiensis]|uniref:Uncharacterized protein n=1 Tax=Sphingomonas kyeonggiensis TaxID=1268553 RepID=A0A7W7NRC8_9SPHN|nr:hypothetical protein [Sphingomonas kyeonggiensis]MBB4837454.1 hypothetical protein [Sphingomonas kyeonggiensis]
MTSISSLSQRPDPRAQMDARIGAAASAGTISSDDQNALSSALDTIDTSLASDRASGGKPGDMKERINGLIDSQVESGALTDDQAEELKSFFAQGPDGGQGGPGGPQGAGGPPPGPPPSGTSDSDEDSTDDTDTTTQISEAAARQLEAMTAFLQKLRDAAASGSATYGSNAGTSSNGSSATGWVIDRQA